MKTIKVLPILAIFLFALNSNAANIDPLKVTKCLYVSAKYQLVSNKEVSVVSKVLFKFYNNQAHLIQSQQLQYLSEVAKNELLQLNVEQQLLFLGQDCLQEPAAQQFLKSGKY